MAIRDARRFLIGFGAALACVVPHAARAQNVLEYEVKAAYLYNFVHFIEWPLETLGDPGEPFRVCVYGANPFGASLDRTFLGEKVQNHPVAIVRPAGDADLSQCRIVFVSRGEPTLRTRALRAATAPGQLVVGESDRFIEEGGAINFLLAAGRIRFDVNLPVIQARRLKVSAKLLRLARNLERGVP